ncbi:phage head spike fiber domain-containing protein [Cytobacillus sp. IB215665]|uniref:phage head spike fiber domain-containing protein n=1 Tax=Cytobacillus sp. IB215665 TaxID=3097357 RepID=UPI002A0C5014|nr:carbohydrate binding domain-containing protein [Cytobacillus sp. IB215665]MDX8366151.1 carbohydrate binding domain-containing protein [Cytobacillus sp. IB215665]
MKKLLTILFLSMLICLSFFGQKNIVVEANENTGSFSLLTYNVAGLWDPVSSSNPADNTEKISPKLNNYDVVLVQEDFNYHSDLISAVEHEYMSSHSGIMGFGDGLNRMSIYPFTKFKREDWNDCHGVFGDGSDCLTPKGFSFARHEVTEGVFIDIYNVHADAGGSNDDYTVRKKNFQQLFSKIEQWSEDHAVIVTGDFNSHWKDTDGVRQFVDANFSDAWAEIKNNGEIPDIGESGGRIDKILFRSSDGLTLNVTDYDVPHDDFLDSNGKGLSDHKPVSAMFEYSVNNLWEQPLNTFSPHAWNKGNNTSFEFDENVKYLNGDRVAKLIAKEENGYVNNTIQLNPNNRTYTFSVWLMSEQDQQVSVRLRSQGNLNGGNGNNDRIQTVNLKANEWQRVEVSQAFDIEAEWLRATIYPAGYQTGETGTIYMWGSQVLDTTNSVVEHGIDNGEAMLKLTAVSNGGYVNNTINLNPNGHTYTYSMLVKSDVEQALSIRLRAKGYSGNNGNNDQVKTVNVAPGQWQRVTITQTFDDDAEWLRATIYPAGFQTGQAGSIYVKDVVVTEGN